MCLYCVKEVLRERRKNFVIRNEKIIRQKEAEYKNTEAYRISRLKQRIKKYDLTLDEYDKILEFQDSKCAICKREDQKLNIDHDHKTNEVRGLLCSNCNFILGMANDNSDILIRAIDYLAKYGRVTKQFEEEYSPG